MYQITSYALRLQQPLLQEPLSRVSFLGLFWFVFALFLYYWPRSPTSGCNVGETGGECNG